jgi:hypothetical protein
VDPTRASPGAETRSVDGMTRRTRAAGGSLPDAGWFRPWVQLVEIAWSAPLVIGYRTVRLATGGWPPSARDRREYTRMVQEKAEAFGQVAVAAARTGPTYSARAVSSVLSPVHRRVVANRRRLSRG